METMALPTSDPWHVHVGKALQDSVVPAYLRVSPDCGLPDEDIWDDCFASVAESMCEFAINSPGDSDSIGALGGGLVGAYHGLSLFPEQWINELERSQDLMALAGDLHHSSQA